jgi:hypothetical protein
MDPIPQTVLAPTIEMVNYKNTKAFNRDAPARLAAGWRLQDHAGGQDKTKLGSKLLTAGAISVGTLGIGAPVALASLAIPWRKKGKVTVTWVRDNPK